MNANASGIQIPVQPWGRDANGYPLYIDDASNVYYANGEYMGVMSGARDSKNRFYLIVRSPSGKVFKFGNPFNGPF